MKHGQTPDEVDDDISEFGWRTVRAGEARSGQEPAKWKGYIPDDGNWDIPYTGDDEAEARKSFRNMLKLERLPAGTVVFRDSDAEVLPTATFKTCPISGKSCKQAGCFTLLGCMMGMGLC